MKYNAPYGSLDPDAPYVDRNTPNAQAGSKVPALAVEAPQREIVEVIEQAGITPDEEDNTQLWQALKFFLDGIRVQFPIYPECRNSNFTFDVTTPVAGTIRIPAGIEWVMRGATLHETVQTDLATTASKTYHLRWDAANGFRMRDLASVGYNPSALAETDPVFDTTYDDLLIACVVTNGSNVATVTNLQNRAFLDKESYMALPMASALNWATLANSAVTLNWARKPRKAQPALQGFRSFNLPPDGSAHGTGAGIIRAYEIRTVASSINRYGAGNLEYWYEDDIPNDGFISFIWNFSAS